MFDLNKLSYTAYGNLVIIILIATAILFNLFPFSLIGLILCISQIPIYLIARGKFKDPIHANGLNICFFLTLTFYVLLFIAIKCMFLIMNECAVIIISCVMTILGCYSTSTLPNKMKLKGKLFFGFKKRSESKYNKLIEYIKFNGLNEKLISAERSLKDLDPEIYLFYKRKFRENKTFKEINEEFEIDNPRIVEILDKAYFYMIGALGI